MERHSVTAEIFGYLICLLAVLIFFVGVAGVVSNAFRIVHPTATHRMLTGPMDARFGQPHGMAQAPDTDQSTGAQPGRVRERVLGGARFDALRRFVVALVMLVLSIVIFRRAFAWLNPRQAVM